ncbi:site-specific integrase [Pseudonocardia sp. N23]|uniref:tyrosine-type recombinase/integrase n=1 Tax=Pseudonocardia sp. N23 TaxID=1987376 RepID=UPI00209C1831|nr:site-specific integrase [Pseudonocardia sp. N23]
MTGKPNYLTESTRDEREAQKILTRLLGTVDEQRNPRTKATFGTALTSWLRTHEAEASTMEGYRGYVRRVIDPRLGHVPIAKVTTQVLEEFYADLRRCGQLCDGREGAVDHRTSRPHECRVVRHKRRPGRPGPEPHECDAAGCTVVECPPHSCRPMAASTIRQVHWIISAALAAAVRWEWIRTNPAEKARKPRQPRPQPDPPSAAEAALILETAWRQDSDWGALVWLVMVTGMRRAEALALRWSDVELDAGMVAIRRNFIRSGAQRIEKDTKTHQMRRIALDTATVAMLAEHRQRYEEQVRAVGAEPRNDTYLFSYDPLRTRPADPSAVTHRYGRMCRGVGIETRLHALRHYSATELLTAGVDLRTVAGRLGHGGGGTTTLRVYAAWVGESDRKASEILGSRMTLPQSRVEG